MSLPLWSTRLLISIPCSEKKPFLIPRSIGRAFAIGSVFTVIVTVACGFAGADAAVAPKATTTASKPAIEAPRSFIRPFPVAIPFIPTSWSGVAIAVSGSALGRGEPRHGFLLSLDQPVHVRTKVCEVRQFLRLDLVARMREGD